MNVTKNEPLSPADDLIQKYEALTKAAGDLLYPKTKSIRESWPDTSSWKWIKKLFFFIDKPYVLEPFVELRFVPIIAFILRYFLFLFAIQPVMYALLLTTGFMSPSEVIESSKAFFIFFSVLILFNLVLSIGNIAIAITHQINARKRTTVVLTRIVLPLLFFALIVLLQGSYNLPFLWYLASFGVFFSGCSVFISNVPQTINWIIDQLISSGKSLKTFHSPQQTKGVKEIVSKPITIKDENKFILSDLPRIQIESIRDWAKANQETSEQRLNPLLIFLGFIALFAGSQWFQGRLDNLIALFIRFFTGEIQSNEYSHFVLVLGIIILVGAFMLSIALIFKNINAQSLIVESCIVAEYSIKVREEDRTKAEIKTREKLNFLQKMINCFCKKDYNQP